MSNSEIIATYFKAIQTGDLAKLGALVAADVIWHQPGDNQFSGTHTGAEAVFAMIGSMMEASAGTFKIDLVKDIMVMGQRLLRPSIFLASAMAQRWRLAALMSLQ